MHFCISLEIQHPYQNCSCKQPPHCRHQVTTLPEGKKKTSVHIESFRISWQEKQQTNIDNYSSVSAQRLTLEELAGKSSDERGKEAMLKQGSSTNLVKTWLL